jgi:hypothetical protein
LGITGNCYSWNFVSGVITSFSAQELNVDQIQSELLNK